MLIHICFKIGWTIKYEYAQCVSSRWFDMAVIVFAHPLAKSHYWDDFLSPIYGLSKKKALFVILQLEYFSSLCSELEKMDYSIPNLLKPNVQTFTKAKKNSYCQMIILCLISSLKCLNVLIIDLKQHTAKFPNDLSFWINHSCLSMMI